MRRTRRSPRFTDIAIEAGVSTTTVDRVLNERGSVYEGTRGVVAEPDVRGAMLAQGAEPRSNTPQEFQKIIEADMRRYSALIKKLDLRAE